MAVPSEYAIFAMSTEQIDDYLKKRRNRHRIIWRHYRNLARDEDAYDNSILEPLSFETETPRLTEEELADFADMADGTEGDGQFGEKKEQQIMAEKLLIGLSECMKYDDEKEKATVDQGWLSEDNEMESLEHEETTVMVIGEMKEEETTGGCGKNEEMTGGEAEEESTGRGAEEAAGRGGKEEETTGEMKEETTVNGGEEETIGRGKDEESTSTGSEEETKGADKETKGGRTLNVTSKETLFHHQLVKFVTVVAMFIGIMELAKKVVVPVPALPPGPAQKPKKKRKTPDPMELVADEDPDFDLFYECLSSYRDRLSAFGGRQLKNLDPPRQESMAILDIVLSRMFTTEGKKKIFANWIVHQEKRVWHLSRRCVETRFHKCIKITKVGWLIRIKGKWEPIKAADVAQLRHHLHAFDETDNDVIFATKFFAQSCCRDCNTTDRYLDAAIKLWKLFEGTRKTCQKTINWRPVNPGHPEEQDEEEQEQGQVVLGEAAESEGEEAALEDGKDEKGADQMADDSQEDEEYQM